MLVYADTVAVPCSAWQRRGCSNKPETTQRGRRDTVRVCLGPWFFISLLRLGFPVLRCRPGQSLFHSAFSFAYACLWLARPAQARVVRFCSPPSRTTSRLSLVAPVICYNPFSSSVFLQSSTFQWLPTPPSRHACRATAPSDACSSPPQRSLPFLGFLFPCLRPSLSLSLSPLPPSSDTSLSRGIALGHRHGAAHRAATAPPPLRATFATAPNPSIPNPRATTLTAWRSCPARLRPRLPRIHHSSASRQQRPGPEMSAALLPSNDPIPLAEHQTICGHGRKKPSSENARGGRRKMKEPPRKSSSFCGKPRKTSGVRSNKRRKRRESKGNGRLNS